MSLKQIACSGLVFLAGLTGLGWAGEDDPKVTTEPVPPPVSQTPAVKADEAKPDTAAKGDILETLKTDGHYKTLLSLIETAGMNDDLRAAGQLTLFAPTDDAMLKAGNLDSHRRDPAALRSALNNHLVAGAFTLTQLEKVTSLSTRGGLIWTITANGRRIHDANIVQADMAASNGVVQGIDSALVVNLEPATRVVQANDDITLKRVEGKVEIHAKNTGDTIYGGLKEGTDKTYDGLKTGSKKIKNFFTGN